MLVYLCAIRSVQSVRSLHPIIYVCLYSAFYRAGGQTRDVDPMLG